MPDQLPIQVFKAEGPSHVCLLVYQPSSQHPFKQAPAGTSAQEKIKI